MAMGFSSCTALVARPTLGAIWVGPAGCHWPTKCGTPAKNALFECISIYGNSRLRLWDEIFFRFGKPGRNFIHAPFTWHVGPLWLFQKMGLCCWFQVPFSLHPHHIGMFPNKEIHNHTPKCFFFQFRGRQGGTHAWAAHVALAPNFAHICTHLHTFAHTCTHLATIPKVAPLQAAAVKSK